MRLPLHNKVLILLLSLVIGFFGLVLLIRWVAAPYTTHWSIPWEEKVENIERIFFHEYFRFTYIVRRGEVFEPVTFTHYHNDNSKLTYYRDVPDDKSMWAIVRGKGDPQKGMITSIEIHLHSIQEVEGRDWNHGKFGSGQTVVIE